MCSGPSTRGRRMVVFLAVSKQCMSKLCLVSRRLFSQELKSKTMTTSYSRLTAWTTRLGRNTESPRVGDLRRKRSLVIHGFLATISTESSTLCANHVSSTSKCAAPAGPFQVPVCLRTDFAFIPMDKSRRRFRLRIWSTATSRILVAKVAIWFRPSIS